MYLGLGDGGEGRGEGGGLVPGRAFLVGMGGVLGKGEGEEGMGSE